MRVDLAGPIDVGDFRVHANSMLAHQVEPADVAWHAAVSPDWGVKFTAGRGASMRPSALHSIVPRSFVRLTELVVLHRDPERFDLLYRLLWRLVHEPELAGGRGDADMAVAQSMAQSVRRDIVRTRKSVHLLALAPQEDAALSVGWCSPQHQVTEQVAEGLVRQYPSPPWLLASPDRCVLWTGRHLLCGPGMTAGQASLLDEPGWYALAAQLASTEAACAS